MDLFLSFIVPDNLAHVAYALIAFSFVVKDILFLRTLSIIASVSFIMFFVHRETFIPVYWNIGFITVNVYHIIHLVSERKGIKFNEYEEELYHSIFPMFSHVEFMKLIRLAEWKVVLPGETLTQQDEEQNQMILLYHGRASVEVAGRKVAELKDGAFIGEMAFLTGESASATVVVDEETRYVAWEITKLKSFLIRNPSLRFGLQGVIGQDLSKKLRGMDEHQEEQ
ncbi:MAG: cyclic nucleotide-binding domain-containing protein [Planctomycetota bacterium]|nr:cyclic nucleotide-binding domain-containing protein [Planctomycetota bacterium]